MKTSPFSSVHIKYLTRKPALKGFGFTQLSFHLVKEVAVSVHEVGVALQKVGVAHLAVRVSLLAVGVTPRVVCDHAEQLRHGTFVPSHVAFRIGLFGYSSVGRCQVDRPHFGSDVADMGPGSNLNVANLRKPTNLV